MTDDMLDSILLSIKKLLNIHPEDTTFDADIILGINTALSNLTQIGVGPSNGMSITNASTTWVDFLGNRPNLFQQAKSYVHIQTKLLFDPPSNSFIVTMYQDMLKEYAWRLSIIKTNAELKKGLTDE